MDLDLRVPSYGFGSGAGHGWGWQCDFHFGYGPDLIEEEAINEKCCVQVLKCLIAKADTEIFELEDDLAILKSQFKWQENEHEKLYELWCAVFREKISSLNSSLAKVKNGSTPGRHAPRTDTGACHEPLERIYEVITSLLNENAAVESEQSVANMLVISDPLSTGEIHKEQSSTSLAADSSLQCVDKEKVKVQDGYGPLNMNLESNELNSSGASTFLSILPNPGVEKEKYEEQDKSKSTVSNGFSSNSERTLTTYTNRGKDMGMHYVRRVVKAEPVVVKDTVERRNRFSESCCDYGKTEDVLDFAGALETNKSCGTITLQEGNMRGERSSSTLMEQLCTMPILEGHIVKDEPKTGLKQFGSQLNRILDAELAFSDDQPIANLLQNPQMLKKRKISFDHVKVEIDPNNLVVNGRGSSPSNPSIAEGRNRKNGGGGAGSSVKNRSSQTTGNSKVESQKARPAKQKLACTRKIQDSALGLVFADPLKNADNRMVATNTLMGNGLEGAMGLPLCHMGADELQKKILPDLRLLLNQSFFQSLNHGILHWYLVVMKMFFQSDSQPLFPKLTLSPPSSYLSSAWSSSWTANAWLQQSPE